MRNHRLHLRAFRTALAAVVAALSGCAGGAVGTSSGTPGNAPDPDWQALATPRTPSVPGAARVSLSLVEVNASPGWAGLRVGPSLAITEIGAAALLGRADVHFVERRRFAAAAERERRGLPREAGAPVAGVSQGPEFLASAAWSTLGAGESWVDVRLVDVTTGSVRATWRGRAEAADPVTVARSVVAGVLGALGELNRLPDASAGEALPVAPASGVPMDAVRAFTAGLAAEEGWAWREAAAGYAAALRAAPDFTEAAEALARTARLRLGATLAEG